MVDSLRAAARSPGETDTLAIHFGPTDQVIHGADRVPEIVLTHMHPGQNRLGALNKVIVAAMLIKIAPPLDLAVRVECEHEIALARQGNAMGLHLVEIAPIDIGRLAARIMPQWPQDGRKGRI